MPTGRTSRNIPDSLLPEYNKKINKLKNIGLNNKQIAKRFGIHYEHLRSIIERIAKKGMNV